MVVYQKDSKIAYHRDICKSIFNKVLFTTTKYRTNSSVHQKRTNKENMLYTYLHIITANEKEAINLKVSRKGIWREERERRHVVIIL